MQKVQKKTLQPDGSLLGGLNYRTRPIIFLRVDLPGLTHFAISIFSPIPLANKHFYFYFKIKNILGAKIICRDKG